VVDTGPYKRVASNYGRKEYYSLCPWKTVRFDDENKCGKVFDGIDGNLDPNSSDGKEVFDGRKKSFLAGSNLNFVVIS
jgi:hypothetical protein